MVDNIRVLHVDDEPDVTEVTGEFLEREDERMKIATETSPNEGLDRLERDEFDCVVIDYDMPGTNGIDFLKTVRDEYPNLPLILYTGKGSEAVASEAFSAGATDYIQKDSGTDQYELLGKAIVEFVEKYRTEQELDELRRQFTTLVEQNFVGIYIIQDGEFTYVNSRLADIHGYHKPAEVIGKSPLDLVAPSERERVQSNLDERMFGEKTVMQYQTTGLTKHGEFIDIELHGRFIEMDGEPAVIGAEADVTEQKRRKRELERHAAYLDQSQDYLTVVDEDGRVTFQSKPTDGSVGYDEANIIGDSVFEYIHPKDRERVTDLFTTILGSPGDSAQTELRVKTNEGSWRWMEARAVNKLDDSVVDGIVVNSHDITQRKEREQQIQRLKDRLELAVEGAELGVWDWDMTTDEVEFNEQWARMLGLSLDEIEPHLTTWEKRLHPEDVDDVEAALDAHIAGETDFYDTEHRLRTADGGWQWIRDIGKIFERDQDGEPTRAVGVHIDISDRKEREQKLRQFRKAVERTAHVVYITDREGTIEYVNPAFEEITGFSAAEAVGQTPRILKSGEYGDDYYQKLWETILSGDQWQDEMLDNRADGQDIFLDQTISSISNKAGQPQKFVAVAHDITQRKEYEQQLEEQRDNLEILNQVVRHDIRNNLQVVLAFAETLDSYVEEDGQEYIDKVLDAARDAVRITTTARDVTEVMLQSDVEKRPISLQSALETEIEELRAEQENAIVAIDGSIPAVSVLADDMLESVFRNLLNNALQHNDKEVPQVTAEASCGDKKVQVRIVDNGPGIPDERKADIFEQGEMSLDSDGTGLGLYIVDTLVDRYGGEVWVEDNDPDGTIFTVELPIAESD